MKKEDTRTPEQLVVSSYMSHLGKVGGGRNKQKGSEYFKWVRSHRKPKDEKLDMTDTP